MNEHRNGNQQGQDGPQIITGLDPLLTPDDLAARYGKSHRWVLQQARTSWPHVKAGRSVLFTADHVRAIDQLLTVTPDPAEEIAASWGRRTRRSR